MKLSTLATFVLLALASCSHETAPAASATTTTSCSMCPMHVAGATASEADVEGGAALDIKTSTGDVADLRARARKMAAMSDQCTCPMMAKMKSTPSTATVEDIEGGARITYKPKDPNQLAALRENVRDHAQHMHAGCPMMAH